MLHSLRQGIQRETIDFGRGSIPVFDDFELLLGPRACLGPLDVRPDLFDTGGAGLVVPLTPQTAARFENRRDGV